MVRDLLMFSEKVQQIGSNFLSGHKKLRLSIAFIPHLDFKLLFPVHPSKLGKCLLDNQFLFIIYKNSTISRVTFNGRNITYKISKFKALHLNTV